MPGTHICNACAMCSRTTTARKYLLNTFAVLPTTTTTTANAGIDTYIASMSTHRRSSCDHRPYSSNWRRCTRVLRLFLLPLPHSLLLRTLLVDGRTKGTVENANFSHSTHTLTLTHAMIRWKHETNIKW